MYRLSIFGDLIGRDLLCSHRLASAKQRTARALLMVFVLVSPQSVYNTLNNIAAVILSRRRVSPCSTNRSVRCVLFLRCNQGEFISEIFWGVWLFPFGLLVYRSGFLPRILGIWLIIACFAWVALSITAQFFPTNYSAAFGWLQPAFFAEMAIMLWLLIRGANVKALPAEAS